VTRPMREQLHTTPVNTTWTADFLTLEGEGRKAMGDWLRDKSIPWKARRRLLLTNSETFPCEHFRASPASRKGVSTRMGYVAYVSDEGRWAWDFWAETPLEAPQVIYKTACVDFKLQQTLGRITSASLLLSSWGSNIRVLSLGSASMLMGG
jgi:hypothetical protein